MRTVYCGIPPLSLSLILSLSLSLLSLCLPLSLSFCSLGTKHLSPKNGRELHLGKDLLVRRNGAIASRISMRVWLRWVPLMQGPGWGQAHILIVPFTFACVCVCVVRGMHCNRSSGERCSCLLGGCGGGLSFWWPYTSVSRSRKLTDITDGFGFCCLCCFLITRLVPNSSFLVLTHLSLMNATGVVLFDLHFGQIVSLLIRVCQTHPFDQRIAGLNTTLVSHFEPISTANTRCIFCYGGKLRYLLTTPNYSRFTLSWSAKKCK